MNFSVVLRKAVDAEIVGYQVAGGKLGNVQSAIGTRGGYNLIIPQHLAGNILGDSSRYLRVAVGKQILAIARISEGYGRDCRYCRNNDRNGAQDEFFYPLKTAASPALLFFTANGRVLFAAVSRALIYGSKAVYFHYGTRPKVLFLLTVPRQNGMFYSAAPKQAIYNKNILLLLISK